MQRRALVKRQKFATVGRKEDEHYILVNMLGGEGVLSCLVLQTSLSPGEGERQMGRDNGRGEKKRERDKA